MLQVEILSREEAVPYGELFEKNASAFFQQSLLWADLISPLSPDEPYFLLVRENGLPVAGLPLFYFKGALGGVLTSVPHAGPLGGFFSSPSEVKGRYFEKGIQAAKELAQELECVSLTLITNPFQNDALLYGGATYTLQNYCQAISLDKVSFNEKDEISVGHSTFNNKLRRNIRIAKDQGLTVGWAEPQEFDPWFKVHEERQYQLGAKVLPKELLSQMSEVLPKRQKGGLAVVKKDGKIIGGGLFFWHRDVADAYILSSSEESFHFRPNYLLTEFLIKELKKKDIKILNWQSCKKNSGVYQFKKGWGSEEYAYHFLTWTFPGFTSAFNWEVEKVEEAYLWHYLAPFEAIKFKKSSGVFQKA